MDLELHACKTADQWHMHLELSRTQRQYAQIERELLAVVFACKKFKEYIYGKPTIVETDHQPLATILRKPIHTAPARLQRMLLRLQCYDISLVYKKGKYMYLADTLSRAPNTQISQSPADNDAFEVMSVSYISTARLEELRKHRQRMRCFKPSVQSSKEVGLPKKANSNQL